MYEFRSAMFIPGASEKMLAKTASLDADLILFDLEDAVAENQKETARKLVAEQLRQPRQENKCFGVRVNSLSSDHTAADLEAILPAKPDLLMLPKIESGDDLIKIDAMLSAIEASNQLEFASTKLIVLSAETPGSLFKFDSLENVSGRLVGMTWGAEDLATELGAAAGRSESGHWLPPLQLAQTFCLAKARDLGLQPIDTVYADIRNLEALKKECLAAKEMGFTGKLAIHPAQLDVINEVFSPSVDEVDYATRLVKLFADNPDSGALQLDGKMVDVPHLRSAERLLERNKG